MNSTAVFRTYKIARISVQKSNWEMMKDLENYELTDKHEEVVMSELRARADNNVKLSNNPLKSCRKCTMAHRALNSSNGVISPIVKRVGSDQEDLGARP